MRHLLVPPLLLVLPLALAALACAPGWEPARAPDEGAPIDEDGARPDAGRDGPLQVSGAGPGDARAEGESTGPAGTRDAAGPETPDGGLAGARIDAAGPATRPDAASTPEAGGSPPAAPGTGRPPSRYLPLLPLDRIGNRLAYNPHRNHPFVKKGIAHTHCDEDHGGPMTCRQQLERFRDLPGPHRHDFLWMTAHQRVEPDPGVGGILFMFGMEVYTSQDASAGAPHIVALLPEGALPLRVKNPLPPVGAVYRPWTERLTAIAQAGGLPTIAHPGRYGFTGSNGPSIAAGSTGDTLWGIEIVNPSVPSSDTEKFVDAVLGAGRYVCASAGSDTHGGTVLTRGYQLVSTRTAQPTRAELFAEVKACNFFACGNQSTSSPPFTNPTLKIEDGRIVFSIDGNPDVIQFVGRGGRTLHSVAGQGTASFQPPSAEPYVRARALRGAGGAECYSQAIWFLPG